MELRQLRYFVTIADRGSFSRAAEVLNVAQSALSHQLALLEEELGTRLLHRMPRGVTATEAGQVFHAHAVSVLRQVEDARLSVRAPLGLPRGKVSLGVPSSVCNALAAPLLHRVRAELPGVELEMTEQASGTLAAQLNSGVVNLAILFDDVDLTHYTSRALVEEGFYLIARQPLPKDEEGYVSFSDALAGPLVLASQQQGVRRIIEATARKHGLKPPNVVAELNSVSILRSALIAGIGNTILPPMSLWHELETGLLFGNPIRDRTLRRRVHVCASPVVPMTTATTAVFDLIHRLAHELVMSNDWVEGRLPGSEAGA